MTSQYDPQRIPGTLWGKRDFTDVSKLRTSWGERILDYTRGTLESLRSLKEGGREVKGRNGQETGTEKNRIMLPSVLEI